MKVYEGNVAPPGEGKIAIIVSKYNRTVTANLLDGAVTKLKENGVRDADITVVWVPGAFEIPTMAGRFAFDEEYQAVICLGCVIKGETTHDEHINRAVSQEIARLGVESGIPVIFGVLTCNTKEQAIARSAMTEPSNDKVVGEVIGNKGTEAAEAALEMLDLFIQLPELEDEEEIGEDLLRANAYRYQNGDFDGEFDDDDFEEAEDMPFFDRRRDEDDSDRFRQKPKKSKPQGGSFGGKKGGFKGNDGFRGGDGKHPKKKGDGKKSSFGSFKKRK